MTAMIGLRHEESTHMLLKFFDVYSFVSVVIEFLKHRFALLFAQTQLKRVADKIRKSFQIQSVFILLLYTKNTLYFLLLVKFLDQLIHEFMMGFLVPLKVQQLFSCKSFSNVCSLFIINKNFLYQIEFSTLSQSHINSVLFQSTNELFVGYSTVFHVSRLSQALALELQHCLGIVRCTSSLTRDHLNCKFLIGLFVEANEYFALSPTTQAFVHVHIVLLNMFDYLRLRIFSLFHYCNLADSIFICQVRRNFVNINKAIIWITFQQQCVPDQFKFKNQIGKYYKFKKIDSQISIS